MSPSPERTLAVSDRAKCRACFKEKPLRKDGTFRRHNWTRFGITYECPGSHTDWISRPASEQQTADEGGHS